MELNGILDILFDDCIYIAALHFCDPVSDMEGLLGRVPCFRKKKLAAFIATRPFKFDYSYYLDGTGIDVRLLNRYTFLLESHKNSTSGQLYLRDNIRDVRYIENDDSGKFVYMGDNHYEKADIMIHNWEVDQKNYKMDSLYFYTTNELEYHI